RSDLIVNDIKPGDVIVGLASYGQSTYEKSYNGGMGSNGLTSARHDVFSHDYAAKYPESFDPSLPDQVVYVGSKKLTDEVAIGNGQTMTAGKLVLSPTRTYLPVIAKLLKQLKSAINGMIHNTGGGLSKVVKFVDGVRIVKDNLMPLPPLFQMIHDESGTDWQEMYQVFNMGQRLEVYLPKEEAQQVIDIAREFNIDAQIIGRVEKADAPSVRVESPYGTFEYDH
ncbi:MAG: phosphoribosylformylglycinamidine cyclo-ligase, partial [Phaeodactylibacter sp.]|nr:phosphoribosylformylglycinamidine cyclo-ligase [Phaeodactylibacter sp.]